MPCLGTCKDTKASHYIVQTAGKCLGRFFYFMDENKITRLAVQKKNPKRVNVYIDGNFAFGLYRDTAAWLETGQILSDDKIKELLDKDLQAEVYQKALDYISFKPRTTQETRKKLQQSGYDELLIEDTITSLTENGLLDDKYYAEQWVDERQRYKPRSKRALVFELRKKGISDNLIQSAVEDVDDIQSGYEIARSRLFRYEGLSKYEFRNKLGNYLAGKGYPFDVISEITKDLWDQLNTSAN